MTLVAKDKPKKIPKNLNSGKFSQTFKKKEIAST